MRCSPIPKFDTPKLHMNAALQLFGAGREKRIYAVPPYTEVKPLDFDDHPFEIERWPEACALCASADSFLDEVILDDKGGRMFVRSEEHTSELQSLMRISYAVFCLKKKKQTSHTKY